MGSMDSRRIRFVRAVAKFQNGELFMSQILLSCNVTPHRTLLTDQIRISVLARIEQQHPLDRIRYEFGLSTLDSTE